MERREEYFDLLRAVAIVMVIGIHAFGLYAVRTGITPLNGFSPETLIRQLFGCAVPLFLAISGYFMAGKKCTGRTQWSAFEKKHILRVYLPCLVWSFPLLIDALKTEDSGILPTVLFFTGGYSVYYFIILIIQFYLLLPGLQRLAALPRGGGIIISLVVSATALLLTAHIQFDRDTPLRLILYAGPFPLWSVFFVLGLWLGQGNRIRVPLSLLVLFTAATLAYTYAQTRSLLEIHGPALAYGNLKISWLLYSCAMILLLFSLRERYVPNRAGRLLARIGRVSFGIYLIHMHLLDDLLRTHFPGMDWIAAILLTLALSLVIILPVKRAFPGFACRYLGF